MYLVGKIGSRYAHLQLLLHNVNRSHHHSEPCQWAWCMCVNMYSSSLLLLAKAELEGGCKGGSFPELQWSTPGCGDCCRDLKLSARRQCTSGCGGAIGKICPMWVHRAYTTGGRDTVSQYCVETSKLYIPYLVHCTCSNIRVYSTCIIVYSPYLSQYCVETSKLYIPYLVHCTYNDSTYVLVYCSIGCC